MSLTRNLVPRPCKLRDAKRAVGTKMRKFHYHSFFKKGRERTWKQAGAQKQVNELDTNCVVPENIQWFFLPRNSSLASYVYVALPYTVRYAPDGEALPDWRYIKG